MSVIQLDDVAVGIGDCCGAGRILGIAQQAMHVGNTSGSRPAHDHRRTSFSIDEPFRRQLVVGDEDGVARHTKQPGEHAARWQPSPGGRAAANGLRDLPGDLSMKRRRPLSIECDWRQEELARLTHNWPFQVALPTVRLKADTTAMIANGNATVHVADLAKAIQFYTETLGFTLANRIGDRWATIDAGSSYWTTGAAGAGLTIGLQPASAQYAAPGTRGGVGFGVETYRAIEDVEAEFKARGIRVSGEIIRFDAGNCFMFEDLDGFPSYVHGFPPEMLDEADRKRVAASGAGERLISGGHAIVYVSNMDAGVRFYTETLGLTLTNRFENHFATVEAGRSLVVGIHPITPRTPTPGSKGSVTLSLVVDEPIYAVLSRLAKRGVHITGQSESDSPRAEVEGRSVGIEDPDGNVITLWEAHALTTDRELAAPGSSARR